MVAGVRLLLATACVAALVAQGHAECIFAHWGGPTIDSWIAILPPVVINARITEVELEIPDPLIGCVVVGSSAYTCSVSSHQDGVEFDFRDLFNVHLRLPHPQSGVKINFLVHCVARFPSVGGAIV